MGPQRIVLVTGTSTGIGREAVGRLVRSGAHVVATARVLDDIEDLEGPEVTCLALDVTDAARRKAVVDEVLAHHGRIDALVNNAGYGANLPVEETTGEDLRGMFEVNLFGLHELTRLVLPHMRDQGSGRIVNVSSVAGHIAIPMMGGYCASKFALRAMTQALHNEVRPHGIHACLVEPGVIRTRFGDRARRETDDRRPLLETGPYGHLHRRWGRHRVGERGGHPRVIARRIVHACLDQRPRFRYVAPLHAKGALWLDRLLPDAMLNAGVRWWLGWNRHRIRQRPTSDD